MILRRGFQNDPNSAIFSKTSDDNLSPIYPENELGLCTHGPCSERHLLNNILKRMPLFTHAQQEAPVKRMPSGGCEFGACITREENQNPHPYQRNIVLCVDGKCNSRPQQDQVDMNKRNMSHEGCNSGNCNTTQAENNKHIMVPSPCGTSCRTTNSSRTEHYDKRIPNNTPCGFGSCGKREFKDTKGTEHLEGTKHNYKRSPLLPGPCGFRPCGKRDLQEQPETRHSASGSCGSGKCVERKLQEQPERRHPKIHCGFGACEGHEVPEQSGMSGNAAPSYGMENSDEREIEIQTESKNVADACGFNSCNATVQGKSPPGSATLESTTCPRGLCLENLRDVNQHDSILINIPCVNGVCFNKTTTGRDEKQLDKNLSHFPCGDGKCLTKGK